MRQREKRLRVAFLPMVLTCPALPSRRSRANSSTHQQFPLSSSAQWLFRQGPVLLSATPCTTSSSRETVPPSCLLSVGFPLNALRSLPLRSHLLGPCHHHLHDAQIVKHLRKTTAPAPMHREILLIMLPSIQVVPSLGTTFSTRHGTRRGTVPTRGSSHPRLFPRSRVVGDDIPSKPVKKRGEESHPQTGVVAWLQGVQGGLHQLCLSLELGIFNFGKRL